MESLSFDHRFWKLTSVLYKFLSPSWWEQLQDCCVTDSRSQRLVPLAQLGPDCQSHTTTPLDWGAKSRARLNTTTKPAKRWSFYMDCRYNKPLSFHSEEMNCIFVLSYSITKILLQITQILMFLPVTFTPLWPCLKGPP